MPSDYEAILESNLHDYGHATRHLDLLRDLHPDRTHFIYELLQNADDAEATWIEFSVARDVLEVTHNGRPFNEADVRGITGIAAGTKADDLTKIGTFGVGFKSVYACTSRPEIHSGDEHFAIEKFIRPLAVPPIDGRPLGLTTFRFPLDLPDLADPFADVQQALASLAPTTLLFLHRLSEVRWSASDGPDGSHRREDRGVDGAGERSILIRDGGVVVGDTSWLVFGRAIDTVELGSPLDGRKVEIAFLTRVDEGQRRVQGLDASPLSAFFPTEKETHLGLLVQGPYRTTPARDNVPPADPLNRRLIHETALLVKEAVRWLRDRDLLDAAALETLPLDAAVFGESSMFHPVWVATRDLLRDEPCIPAEGGGFARGRELALGPAVLRPLLPPDVLAELTGEDGRRKWADATITSARTPTLAVLLRNECGAIELDAEHFVKRLTRPFLEARTDAWICDFYRFLSKHPNLAPSPYYMNAIRGKPIIRLEDGSQVEPFSGSGAVAVFLPRADFELDVPTVRREIAQDESAAAFLKGIGIRAPGLVDQVRRRILPKYSEPRPDPDIEEVTKDAALVTAALAEAPSAGGGSLQADVRKCAIVLARGAADGQVWLVKPDAAYFESPGLRLYLDGNPHAWFVLDEPGYARDMLLELGVREGIGLRGRPTSWDGTVSLASWHGYHARGLSGFDPDAWIDGLDFALGHPTAQRSLFIWNELLTPVAGRLHGIVEVSTRQNYSFSNREDRSSRAATAAASAQWLPGPDGSWVAPGEVRLEDLPPEYVRDEVLASALGMRATDLRAVSAALELPVEVVHRIEHDATFRREVLALFERSMTAAPSAGVEGMAPPSLDHPATLQAAIFARFVEPFGAAEGAAALRRAPEARGARDVRVPGSGGHQPPLRPVVPDADPVRDDETRQLLGERLADMYLGGCQICGTGFRRRSGAPYFEIELLGNDLPLVDRYRLGNALCLCPTCTAKLKYGSVHGLSVPAIRGVLEARSDGATWQPCLAFTLCGEEVELRYSAEHLDDLRLMLEASPDDDLGFEEEPEA